MRVVSLALLAAALLGCGVKGPPLPPLPPTPPEAAKPAPSASPDGGAR